MIWAVNNIVFPHFDLKITINTYKIRFGQKLRMHPVDATFATFLASIDEIAANKSHLNSGSLSNLLKNQYIQMRLP